MRHGETTKCEIIETLNVKSGDFRENLKESLNQDDVHPDVHSDVPPDVPPDRIPNVNHSNAQHTCGICFESMTDKRYALLEGCNHIFCMTCLMQWRHQSHEEHTQRRACPTCRELSYLVVPSYSWPATPEEKESRIQRVLKEKAAIPCSRFKIGQLGSCLYGKNCFYAHLDHDGSSLKEQDDDIETLYQKRLQRRRRREQEGIAAAIFTDLAILHSRLDPQLSMEELEDRVFAEMAANMHIWPAEWIESIGRDDESQGENDDGENDSEYHSHDANFLDPYGNTDSREQLLVWPHLYYGLPILPDGHAPYVPHEGEDYWSDFSGESSDQ